MRYGSVCSGIEAATVAWHPLGWEPAFFAEIEKFPSAVLHHHYPEVKNFGDFTKIEAGTGTAIDLLVGGTPCQDFSVAGLRAGMDGKRGQLTIEFARLAERLQPRWLVWENVPGVLSIDGGRAFGTFLGLLGKLGYGFAYRILDAQFTGVPQRRRRVFVVGHLGDWRRAAAVLFERHSLSGYPPPRREARQIITSSFAPSSHGGYADGIGTLRSNGGDLGGASEVLVSGGFFDWPAEVAQTLDTHYGDKMGLEDQHIRGGASLFVPASSPSVCYGIDEEQNANADLMGCLKSREKGGGFEGAVAYGTDDGCVCDEILYVNCDCGNRWKAIRLDDLCPTCGEHQPGSVTYRQDCPIHAKAYGFSAGQSEGAGTIAYQPEQSPTLRGAASGTNQVPAVQQHMAVRRLVPEECEKLQGFKPGYTKISDKTADGPRYKALGNSMAVPVMRWIGQRIQMVEELERHP